MTAHNKKIWMFADGASKGNPGAAGWGTLIVWPEGRVRELGGGDRLATNNQMELMAVLAGLRDLTGETGQLLILTDSSYVVQGVGSWLARWQRNGWQTATGEPVRNQELWQEMASLLTRSRTEGLAVAWQHVAGHAGIAGNERADRIAHGFAVGEPVALYEGPLAAYGCDPYDLSMSGTPKSAKKRSSKQKAYSYLSYVDGVLVTHKSWPECEARVKGRAGARFKKSLSREDEQAIIKRWQGG